jgi:light-regulated signal transduction histidine kinase (bacteriophytochrome)
MEKDRSFCDLQPIHNLNAIQPHGVLMVLAVDNLKIVQLSDNAALLFDLPVSNMLDAPVQPFLTDKSFGELCDFQKTGLFKNNLPVVLQLRLPGGDVREWLAEIHEKDGCLLVELEWENKQGHQHYSFLNIVQKLQHIGSAFHAASTQDAILTLAVKEIKEVSGFDKVMIYSFDAEWNGTVVAEEAEPGMDVYMGLKFPASDVPKPARDLYLKTPYRKIANIDDEPIGLIPKVNPVTGQFTDLSDCRLRSVMPVHLEYLRNMGVKASMSVRMIYKEQLWGLIACHHRTPKYLSYEACAVFEYLSNVISSKLGSVLMYEAKVKADFLNRHTEELIACIQAAESVTAGLEQQANTLLQLFEADGVAICHAGTVTTYGLAPPEEQVQEIVMWLRGEASLKVNQVPSIAKHLGSAAAYATDASGLLSIPIQPYESNYLLLLRQEVVRTVAWGGDPNRVMHFSNEGSHYHPRNSFAIWKETVLQTAKPWTEEHLSVADKLRNALVELTLKEVTSRLETKVAERTEALNQSKIELEKALKELSQFTFLTTHNLQEAVRKIHFLASKLKEQLAGNPGQVYIEQIVSANTNTLDLIRRLENLSRMNDT